MAFVNFYLIGGGTGSADINAGSTIGAATVGAQVHGTWVNATNTFTAASGTPFASTTNAEYASIYVDGATVTTYVAKINTVTSSTVIVLDGTIKYGTAPSDGSLTRSCVIGGSWNTEQILAAGGLATFTVPQSTKINMKGNLTFAAARIISMAGATTAPLWFSGYNANPGDLDNDTTNILAKPIWTTGANLLTVSGTHTIWSSLNIQGNRNGSTLTQNATIQEFVRLRVTNTNSGTSARAVDLNATASRWICCYFSTPATATANPIISANNNAVWIGCIFTGGGASGVSTATNTQVFQNCVFLAIIGSAVLASTAILQVYACTFYGGYTDGIKWTGTPGATLVSCVVSGCLFSGLNGSTAMTNGINNNSGANTNLIVRSCNDYYNVTNPEVGLGDSYAFFAQTDSSAVVVSASDMTPVPSSNAINHGFPGIFENETWSSYPAIGSTQPLASGFSGGIYGG